MTKQNPYFLLTPGPLSTSPTVREAMTIDSCTWDQDYKSIVTEIRHKLLKLAGCDTDDYTSILMQGSGTFAVESVMGSSINRNQHQVLILQNGVYGKRMVEMAKILDLPYLTHEVNEDKTFSAEIVQELLIKNPTITHIMMVHCETTTGMLNNLEPIAMLAKQYQKYFIVDAMSSFGGIEFDLIDLHIDFLISSANKCIQGIPGFGFIIAKKNSLIHLCQHNAKSLSLDLYGQWLEMEKNNGKWRFTSPTHAVLAFQQALLELDQEGGIPTRAKRFIQNQQILANGMRELGFETYISPSLQSSIITTFIEPIHIPTTNKPFVFSDFYQYLKNKSFVIYPGKVTNKNTFRIGTIGHLFPDDVTRFLAQVKEFIASQLSR